MNKRVVNAPRPPMVGDTFYTLHTIWILDWENGPLSRHLNTYTIRDASIFEAGDITVEYSMGETLSPDERGWREVTHTRVVTVYAFEWQDTFGNTERGALVWTMEEINTPDGYDEYGYWDFMRLKPKP